MATVGSILRLWLTHASEFVPNPRSARASSTLTRTDPGPDFLTDLRFCCAANVVTASVAREPDVYRDCSNRLLDGAAVQPTLMVYTMAYTDG